MIREYQKELSERAYQILKELHIVYLAMEMRVGKTLIALLIAQQLQAKHILFITKKKAIYSIIEDCEREGFDFDLEVINYEQLHKLNKDYDLVIVDEAHLLGAYPKPSLRTQRLKTIVKNNYLILLSGTPTPESFSQIFHQFWISNYSPFTEVNFYKWAHQYVNIKQKLIRGLRINDYSNANQKLIEPLIDKYFVRYTREEAGFNFKDVQENIIKIDIDTRIHTLANLILKENYFKFKNGSEIVIDQPAKLQNKLHQIFSGTVIDEKGKGIILDYSKAKYIKQNYQNQVIAIFYKFKAEREALLKIMGDEITEDIQEFKNDVKRIYISQIQSGSMGTDLSRADILIFYNIDFSAVQYWQARARIQNLNRVKTPQVHWIFSNGGIEEKIYKVVLKKKDYTNYYFKKDYLIQNAK